MNMIRESNQKSFENFESRPTRSPLHCAHAGDKVGIRTPVLVHYGDLFCRFLADLCRSSSLHSLDPPHHCAVDRAQYRRSGNVRANRDRYRRGLCFSGSGNPNLGRGLSANERGARQGATFRGAGGRRTVSLHAKSTLPRECVHGGRNRRPREPCWILFPGDRELGFCLPTDLSRGKGIATNSGRVVSGVLSIRPAVLAIAQAAGCFRKSKTALAAGIRRRNFCMAIWCGRVGDRSDVESAIRLRVVRPCLRRLLYCPTFDPTIKKRPRSRVRERFL
jgi:hypothetical protein